MFNSSRNKISVIILVYITFTIAMLEYSPGKISKSLRKIEKLIGHPRIDISTVKRDATKMADIIHMRQDKSLLTKYKDIPNITMVVRTSGASKFLHQFYCKFLRSVRLFWPSSHGSLSLILDADSVVDSKFGNTFLRQMTKNHPKIKVTVYYEALPSKPQIHWSEYNVRSLGYKRQIWSYFSADLYSTGSIIAFMDTDMELQMPITKGYLFKGNKVKVFGVGGVAGYVIKDWASTTEMALGLKMPPDFMTTSPQLIYKDTITNCRNYITRRFNTSDFESAFEKFFQPKLFTNPISIILTYAWHFERERYDWQMDYQKRAFDTLSSVYGASEREIRNEVTVGKFIPGYCLSLAAVGRAPSRCDSVIRNATQLCDFYEPLEQYPWPSDWCDTETMKACCSKAMVNHYTEVGEMVRGGILNIDKKAFYEVDEFSREMGIKCPPVTLP